jgi:hypothetical protein
MNVTEFTKDSTKGRAFVMTTVSWPKETEL